MNNTLSKEGDSVFDADKINAQLEKLEYAKQEAIAFSNFTTPYYAIRGDKQWQQVEPPFTKYTDDELYDLYLLHKQNKEQ